MKWRGWKKNNDGDDDDGRNEVSFKTKKKIEHGMSLQ